MHTSHNTKKIVTSAQYAVACMLGGPHGKTMYICTSDHIMPDDSLRYRSGKIEAVETSFGRAGWP